MRVLHICWFIFNLLILLVFTFNASAVFDRLQKVQFEEELLQTDRGFVALLKKAIAHRVSLLKRTPSVSVDISSDPRSFPIKLEDADIEFLETFFLPEHLTDSWKIIFDEPRKRVLDEYRRLIDQAAPLEDTDLDEYVRVTQPSNPETYEQVIRWIRQQALEELVEYDEIVRSVEGQVNPVAIDRSREWRARRADFFNAEREFFQPGMQNRDRATLELAYGAFKLAINSNPGSHYIPHARFRFGDIFVQEAYIWIDAGDYQKAKEKLDSALQLYQLPLSLYPNHGRAEYVWFFLGQLAYDQGNIQEAEGAYTNLVGSFPMNEGRLQLTDNAQFMIGVCRSDRGEIRSARDNLNQLTEYAGSLFTKIVRLQLAHLESPVHFNLPGFSLNPEYQREYRALQDVHPQNIESLVVLANLLLDQDRFEKAIAVYEEFYRRSQGTSELEQTDSCFMPLELERQWYHKALLNQGRILLEEGKDYFEVEDSNSSIQKLRRSVEMLEKLVELDEPDTPSLSVQRAASLMIGDGYYCIAKQSKRVEDYENACSAYENVRDHRHLGVDRNYRLATAYLFQEKKQKAIVLLQSQLADLEWLVSFGDNIEGHQTNLDLTYLTLGAIFRGQRRYDKARENYEKVEGETYRKEAEAAVNQIDNFLTTLQLEDF